MLQYSHAFMPKSLPSSHSIGAVHGWCWKDRPELHVVIAAKTQVEELLKPNGVQQGFFRTYSIDIHSIYVYIIVHPLLVGLHLH